jgi:isopenicillin-N epimerase
MPAGLPRRRFLLGLGGASAAAACRPIAAPKTLVADGDWSMVRAQFSLAPDWIHLSALLLASHPKPVRDAIERHRRGMDENPVAWMHANEGTWRMHETAAAYLGVKREEIALTDSTTMGLGITCSGLSFRAGDELVTSTHDHYSLYEATRLAAVRTGATVKRVPMYAAPAQATAQGMIDAIGAAIGDKTRLVAMTWVHSSTGVKIPLRAIADVIAQRNAGRASEDRMLLLVDGVHGFGVESDDLPALGCDVFVTGCHKWLFGPRGTGVIWARPEVWPRMQPVIPHFGAEAFQAWKKGVSPPATNAFMMTPGGYHSFEHRWSLPDAFEFHLALGKQRVRDRTHALNRRLEEGLAAMKHVTLHTPLDDALSAGIVCFDVAGLAPDAVVEKLKAAKIVATATANTPSYARLSAAIFNTEDEIDRTLAAIRGFA